MGIFSCDERCDKLPKIQQQLNEVKQLITIKSCGICTTYNTDVCDKCNYSLILQKLDKIIEECKL